MFLSVVIPVYNAIKYLDECIASLLMQTETDYEIILVDDGSTDGSYELCDSYSTRYTNIKTIHLQNSGPVQARRTGMFAAQGDYLYLIDADDYLISDQAFAIFKQTANNTGCDMMIFDATRNPVMPDSFFNYPFKDGQRFEGDKKQELYYMIIDGSLLNPLWNKVFKKSIIDTDTDYSTDDIPGVYQTEDLRQVLPLITKTDNIVYIDKILYYYRPTEGSIINRFNPKLFLKTKNTYNIIIRYAKMWDLRVGEERLNTRRITYTIIAVKKLVYCSKESFKTESCNFLKSISGDDFFRSAYSHAQKKSMRFADKLIVTLLYHRKITLLRMIIGSYRLINSIRAT